MGGRKWPILVQVINGGSLNRVNKTVKPLYSLFPFFICAFFKLFLIYFLKAVLGVKADTQRMVLHSKKSLIA